MDASIQWLAKATGAEGAQINPRVQASPGNHPGARPGHSKIAGTDPVAAPGVFPCDCPTQGPATAGVSPSGANPTTTH